MSDIRNKGPINIPIESDDEVFEIDGDAVDPEGDLSLFEEEASPETESMADPAPSAHEAAPTYESEPDDAGTRMSPSPRTRRHWGPKP